jgi:hypothetical protein
MREIISGDSNPCACLPASFFLIEIFVFAVVTEQQPRPPHEILPKANQ